MPYTSLQYAYDGGIARLALNRPQAANALNGAMAAELAECLTRLPAEARVAVLTGVGSRAFCAGADLKEREGMDAAGWEAQHRLLRAARDALLACPVPVIAAVNGAAFGGGCELALACDFILAAEDAHFALPEVKLGIIPGMGGMQLLARAVGEQRAKELVYTGRAFSAQEACEWGMVSRVCEPEWLQEAALEMAQAITANAPRAVRAAKRAMEPGVAEGLARELEHYRPLIETADRREGIAAFHEKRKPVFSGN